MSVNAGQRRRINAYTGLMQRRVMNTLYHSMLDSLNSLTTLFLCLSICYSLLK
jgi:hypothetical protein